MDSESFFPKEVTSRVPTVLLTGCERVQIEQHQGLIAYQPEEVAFRTRCGTLTITGQKLLFCRYTATDAVLNGIISSVTLSSEGGGA